MICFQALHHISRPQIGTNFPLGRLKDFFEDEIDRVPGGHVDECLISEAHGTQNIMVEIGSGQLALSHQFCNTQHRAAAECGRRNH